LVIAIAGPGPYSVDALAGLGAVWTEQAAWIVVGIAIVGALVNIVIRRPAKAQSAS
jgi:hypothetical protein